MASRRPVQESREQKTQALLGWTVPGDGENRQEQLLHPQSGPTTRKEDHRQWKPPQDARNKTERYWRDEHGAYATIHRTDRRRIR